MNIYEPPGTQLALAMANFEAWANAAAEEMTLLNLGVVCLTVGLLAAGRQILRDWIKRKGFRMVLKDRNDKIHAIWLEIIQDGIDARLLKGEISGKEAKAMFVEAATKLKLLDLVSKKRIAPHVKETLKRDRAMRTKARKEGTYVEHAPIPGGPPTPIVAEKFSEQLGKTVKKFWQKKSAA